MARLGYSIIFYNENSHVGAGGSLAIRLVVSENAVGSMLGRIYLDGDPPPAFQPLVSNSLQVNGLVANSLYVVEYKDDNGERTLGKSRVFALANSCYNDAGSEQGMIGYIRVYETSVVVWTNVRPTSNPGREISIDGGVTWKQTLNANAVLSWSNSELESLGVDRTIPSVVIRRLSNACTLTQMEAVEVEHGYEPMTADYTATDCTAIGANDGEIILNIQGGSGNRNYVWSDGPVVQNRSNLAPGFYSVTITDVITGEEIVLQDIEISDPAPAPLPDGTLLEVSLLNSIKFVVSPIVADGVSTFQKPDNTLLKDQIYPGYEQTNYNQKVCKADAPPIQFRSDFFAHTLELYNCLDDTLVKSFLIELKEENLGVSEDYPITIQNHPGNPGKSRVYFNVGNPPIPLSVGDVFEILDNAEGFNGNYSIVAITNDPLLGYPYLVINKNYDAIGGSTPGTGRFITSPVNYNVFESVPNFLDVADGTYYMKLRAYGETTEIIAISEPIELAVSHPETILLRYFNYDNAFDITWTTGYQGKIRVEGNLFKRIPGGERSTSRNSDFSIVKTSAKKIRGFDLNVFMLPPYLHEKLSTIFDCDEWYANEVRYQSADGYAEPSYLEKFMLANSSIRVEQVGWFDKYNSDDIGSVNDSGFLLTETGFLKL